MVQLNHISHWFDRDQEPVLNDISLHINSGELFGLIGPDGAGKTTLFRILTTLLLPKKGKATVKSLDTIKDYKEVRKIVGYMPGKFSLYQDLTVEENLNFFAVVFNTTINKNYDLIKDIYVQLEPFKNRRAGKLSGGMKQKLALCCALIHKPEVLFLDEPTTGVDAVSRKEFWLMLKNLKQSGITILVSTPYMDEASLCERIALIQTGNLLSVGTPDEIRSNYGEKLYAIYADNLIPVLQFLRLNDAIKDCNTFGESIHFSINNGRSIEDIIFKLEQFNIPFSSVKEISASIEDCFIKLMK